MLLKIYWVTIIFLLIAVHICKFFFPSWCCVRGSLSTSKAYALVIAAKGF